MHAEPHGQRTGHLQTSCVSVLGHRLLVSRLLGHYLGHYLGHRLLVSRLLGHYLGHYLGYIPFGCRSLGRGARRFGSP